MKALFRNLIWEAALSASEPNPLYPVTNVRHVFLKKAFRSLSTSDGITVEFPADRSISEVYLAFTNAAVAHVYLYDADDDPIFDIAIPVDTLSVEFPVVAGVRSAVITLGALTTVYLGSVGIGVAEILPDPNQNWVPGFIDNSRRSQSADGQVLTNKVPPLSRYQFEILVQDIEEFYRLRALVFDIERPIFVDLFEGRRDLIPAMYGTMDISAEPRKDGNVIRYSLIITEAR